MALVGTLCLAGEWGCGVGKRTSSGGTHLHFQSRVQVPLSAPQASPLPDPPPAPPQTASSVPHLQLFADTPNAVLLHGSSPRATFFSGHLILYEP